VGGARASEHVALPHLVGARRQPRVRQRRRRRAPLLGLDDQEGADQVARLRRTTPPFSPCACTYAWWPKGRTRDCGARLLVLDAVERRRRAEHLLEHLGGRKVLEAVEHEWAVVVCEQHGWERC
jgi:hypothetical protein